MNIFSHEEIPPEEKKTTRIAYVLEKNPYKWGVDVFRYGLPEPRKTRRFDDNLSPDLVPNISLDSKSPKKKMHYVTKLDKTLCPKEEFCEKYVPSIGIIKQQQSILDSTLVPCVSELPKKLFATRYMPGHLSTNLVPTVEHKTRRCRVSTSCSNKQSNICFGPCDPEPIRFNKRVIFNKKTPESEAYIF